MTYLGKYQTKDTTIHSDYGTIFQILYDYIKNRFVLSDSDNNENRIDIKLRQVKEERIILNNDTFDEESGEK